MLALDGARRERGGLIDLPKARGFRRGARVRITRGVFGGQLRLVDGMCGHERVAVLLASLRIELGAGDIRALKNP